MQTLKNNNYKVALIGLGAFGSKRLKQLQSIPLVKILGVYDNNPELNLETQIRKYSSLDELLDTNVEFIIISTPNHTHWNLIKQIRSRSNAKILCEKPILRNNIELMDASSISPEDIRMGSNLPFFSVMKFAGHFIKLYENEVLSCKASIGVAHKSDSLQWRYQKNKSGGGVLIDNGIHLFSLIRSYGINYQVIEANFQYHDLIDFDSEVKLRTNLFPINLEATWNKNIDGYATLELETNQFSYKFYANKDLVQKYNLKGELIKEKVIESNLNSIQAELTDFFSNSKSDRDFHQALSIMEDIFLAYSLCPPKN